ncbi:MAG TPA: FAD-binding oxidoreductase [Vicinamibacteria bacterium]|nr:FAD-binding oxidoreductase [Vicinamibacteria bacterium]
MASIEELRTKVAGDFILPEDPAYDEARKVWNGAIDKRPRAIVRCSDVDDVVASVSFARESNWLVAVRGGGHNAAGLAVCDEGLVIDLSTMRSVEVDPGTRTARAQGGATWSDFDRETSRHGLAATGGAISTTGIGGLTLGGGVGYLMRRYGLACDNLISVEMVTASGRVIKASADKNDDLFWGVRGGGGNFGIVTNFEYQLHPVKAVLGGMLLHPIERARETLFHYRGLMETAPDELTIFAALMTTPDGAPVVAFLVGYCGPPSEGEKVLRPLREFGPPLVDQIEPMPYPKLQSMLDEGFPAGLQVYWRSNFLAGIPDEALDELIQQFSRVTSPLSALMLEPLGGAVARVGSEETAFNHRDAAYNLAVIGRWQAPNEEKTHIAWTRTAHEAMERFATGGVYVNYLGEEGQDRVRAAYGDAKYRRLVALKDKYDPENLFRCNQNIQPTPRR